jgi:hypothetical protein
MFLADYYQIPIYLPDSLIINGLLIFMGAWLVWKVVSYLLDTLPFV